MEIRNPPTSYEEWLDCFDLLKTCSFLDKEVFEIISRGSFVIKGYIAFQFKQKLVDTINEMLNMRIKQFLKELNMYLSLNDLSDIAPLFIKFRNEVRKCLFFLDLDFLDDKFKRDLESSIRTQTEQFWIDTIVFLKKQTLEHTNSDLEDSLFQINRLKLFTQAN